MPPTFEHGRLFGSARASATAIPATPGFRCGLHIDSHRDHPLSQRATRGRVSAIHLSGSTNGADHTHRHTGSPHGTATSRMSPCRAPAY